MGNPGDRIQIHQAGGEDLERLLLPAPRVTVEAEPLPDLLAYWRVVRKRRWTILTVVVVVFTLALIGTLKQASVYRAQTLIEIQKENPDVATVQELFELESVSDTYLETQYKVLSSDSLARRVIDELRLDTAEEFQPSPSWWAPRQSKSAPAAAPPLPVLQAPDQEEIEARQRVLDQFRSRLSVEPVRRSRLVTVSFESTDPQLAARVVNTLASSYIEQSLEARWNATQKASEWISQQLLGLKARVEKSEEELQQYARANGLLFLENTEGHSENIVHERLRQLQEELTRAQADRYQKESLFRLVETGNVDALPGVADNKVLQDLVVRLAEIRREHALLASTFSAEYPRVQQLQSQIDEMESVIARERERAAQHLVNDYRAAMRREELVRQAFDAQQAQADRAAERSVQYNILKREVETNKQLYEGLLQRLREAGVSAGLKASNVRIVDPAAPPKRPVKPRVLLNLSLALVLGLLLGTGGAFLQEYLDNTFKTVEHVERLLHVPALALIPASETSNGAGHFGWRALLGRNSGNGGRVLPARSWFRMDQPGQDHSILSEAFRGLRTSVLLSTADHPPSTLQVASAQPAEGKTTVACNLAISLAQLGQRVLLVDGDMRRPSLHRVFGLDPGRGLVNVLTGNGEWRDVVQATEVESLACVTCGPVPPNPAELLSSQRMKDLLQQARAVYGFVVVDSPPLLSVADGRILATQLEGVILVVRAGSTPRDMAQRAHTLIRAVGASLIGLVLNAVDIRSDDAYGYHYDYYGEAAEAQEKPI